MNREYTNLLQLYKDLEDNATFMKALDFSVRIVKLCRYLTEEKGEHVLSKQILRSGTSIGANISEALAAESKEDFIHKFHISLQGRQRNQILAIASASYRFHYRPRI